MRECFRVSERRACRVLNQPRATQRYAPIERDDEAPLTRRIIELAAAFGRYGYRRITAVGIGLNGFGKGFVERRTPNQHNDIVAHPFFFQAVDNHFHVGHGGG